MKKTKVFMQYYTLIHYRESVFYEINKDERIDFTICCGKKSFFKGVKNFIPSDDLRVISVENKYFPGGFLWQKNIVRIFLRESPEVLVMLGVTYKVLSNFILFFLAKLRGTKVIWWTHGATGRFNKLGKSILSFFYSRADAVMVYDDQGKERMIDMGCSEDNIQVMNNCLNDIAYKRKSNVTTSDKLRLSYIGRIYPGKRIDLLIEAASILKSKCIPFKLTIVGDGENLPELKAMVNDKQLSSDICFTGALYKDDLIPILESTDIGVIPSLVGLSVIQYMAKGVPCITDNGLNNGYEHGPEVGAIIEGNTGMYYQKGNSESLANAIIELSNNLESYKANCIKLVEEKFTPQKVKEAYITGITKAMRNNS